MTRYYILVFAAATVLAMVLTKVVIQLAHRMRWYDPRDSRKVHARAIPRVGGLSIAGTMLILFAVMILLDDWMGQSFQRIGRRAFVVMFGGSLIIFALGIVDDLRGVSAKWKLGVQVLVAFGICALGIRIPLLVYLPQVPWVQWPITIFWIVAITNAVNLIDGLDGLAAGIAAAACASIAAFSIIHGQAAMVMLMLALLGTLVGFLVFNFNPAKIFMGDSGSLFVGFFLATASVVCSSKVATAMGLFLPALALGLPIFDMLLSILRRILERRSIFSPDRGHVHHRLMDRGFKQHHAVILMYLVTLLAAGAGLLMMTLRGRGEVIVFLVALLILMSLFRLAGVLRFRQMWNSMQVNLARRQEVRRERKHFESIQNRFRAAWTFEQWWRAVRRMARRMGFVRVRIEYRDTVGQEMQALHYGRPGSECPPDETMHLSIPVRPYAPGGQFRIEIDVPIDEPMETIGRRVSLFGRLLDEHPPTGLPSVEKLKTAPQE